MPHYFTTYFDYKLKLVGDKWVKNASQVKGHAHNQYRTSFIITNWMPLEGLAKTNNLKAPKALIIPLRICLATT
jgi:hypothetical protein